MNDLYLISPVVAYPPHSGGALNTYNISAQLARFFRLHLYALAPQTPAKQWGEKVGSVEQQHFERTSRSKWGIDPPAARLDYSQSLVDTLKRSDLRNSIVQIQCTSMAQYAPYARASGAIVSCFAEELGFVSQLRRVQHEQNPVRRLRRLAGALSLLRYERHALAQCDLVLCISPEDTSKLKRLLPKTEIITLPGSIDSGALQPCFNVQNRDTVLFVGNYLHPPNLEGAEWLAREVWPIIRQQRPQAKLILAGRMPPPRIQALAAPDIVVPGTLPDLQPLYAQASIVVAPIFWGSGLRIKLMEALCYGVPTVSTAQAAEGLALVDGEHSLFAQQAAEFAAAMLRLLDDSELRLKLSQAGRQLIEQHYDWNQQGQALADRYYAMLAKQA